MLSARAWPPEPVIGEHGHQTASACQGPPVKHWQASAATNLTGRPDLRGLRPNFAEAKLRRLADLPSAPGVRLMSPAAVRWPPVRVLGDAELVAFGIGQHEPALAGPNAPPEPP